ncbi:MAG: 16S rRNA (cytidine(1402)-2'-O)-methyltransferase [Vicinamibacterales bacterium]
MAGTLFVVATPIGNLEDISARAIRVLREVALIAAEDTRRTGHLLQRFGLTTRTISFHEHSEKGKAPDLIGRLKSGESVALVSDAGTPTLSDPGAHLVHLAHEAGIRVEPIPGPCAAVSAVSVSGFGPGGFVFLGFPPTMATDREAWFGRFSSAAACAPTVVFYEAPHRIRQTLDELHGRFGGLEVLLARELTKVHEEIVLTRLGEISIQDPKGEYTVVVNIGQIGETGATTEAPGADKLIDEFREITKNDNLTRRQAISRLARKYRLNSREVFSLIEAGKTRGV